MVYHQLPKRKRVYAMSEPLRIGGDLVAIAQLRNKLTPCTSATMNRGGNLENNKEYGIIDTVPQAIQAHETVV